MARARLGSGHARANGPPPSEGAVRPGRGGELYIRGRFAHAAAKYTHVLELLPGDAVTLSSRAQVTSPPTPRTPPVCLLKFTVLLDRGVLS